MLLFGGRVDGFGSCESTGDDTCGRFGASMAVVSNVLRRPATREPSKRGTDTDSRTTVVGTNLLFSAAEGLEAALSTANQIAEIPGSST